MYEYNEKNNIVRAYWGHSIKRFCKDYQINIEEFNFPVVLDESMESTYELFEGCKSFNQPVVIPEKVRVCSNMFSGCKAFNQPIIIPDKVEQCSNMFMGCESFNQPIKLPNNIINCYGMFSLCKVFNQKVDLPESVALCAGMFAFCSNFNQPVVIGENVENCGNMFGNCISLNQKIELHSISCFYDNLFFNCTSLSPDNVTIFSKRTTKKNLEKKLQKMWGTEEIKGTVNVVIVQNQNKAKITNIHYSLAGGQVVDLTEEKIKEKTITEIYRQLEEYYRQGSLGDLEISEKSPQSMKTLTIYSDDDLFCISVIDEWNDTVYYYNSGERRGEVDIQGNTYPRHMVTSDSEVLLLIIEEFLKTGRPTKKVKWKKE